MSKKTLEKNIYKKNGAFGSNKIYRIIYKCVLESTDNYVIQVNWRENRERKLSFYKRVKERDFIYTQFSYADKFTFCFISITGSLKSSPQPGGGNLISF